MTSHLLGRMSCFRKHEDHQVIFGLVGGGYQMTEIMSKIYFWTKRAIRLFHIKKISKNIFYGIDFYWLPKDSCIKEIGTYLYILRKYLY